MKKLTLLKLSAVVLGTFALASCGLSSLSSTSAPSAASDAASLVSQVADPNAVQNLSDNDKALLNNINQGILNNETMASLLKNPAIDGYVKNAIALVLAKNYISEGNKELANKALSYYNLAKATTAQGGVFDQLKGLLK